MIDPEQCTLPKNKEQSLGVSTSLRNLSSSIKYKVEQLQSFHKNQNFAYNVETCKSPLPPGFEPQISRLQDRHANHYTTAAYTTQQDPNMNKVLCVISQGNIAVVMM